MDRDGIGDACDPDADGDGVLNEEVGPRRGPGELGGRGLGEGVASEAGLGPIAI